MVTIPTFCATWAPWEQRWQGVLTRDHMALENKANSVTNEFLALTQPENNGKQGHSKTWKAISFNRSYVTELLSPCHLTGALGGSGDVRQRLETYGRLPLHSEASKKKKESASISTCSL